MEGDFGGQHPGGGHPTDGEWPCVCGWRGEDWGTAPGQAGALWAAGERGCSGRLRRKSPSGRDADPARKN